MGAVVWKNAHVAFLDLLSLLAFAPLGNGLVGGASLDASRVFESSLTAVEERAEDSPWTATAKSTKKNSITPSV